jgi:hypothetical protein
VAHAARGPACDAASGLAPLTPASAPTSRPMWSTRGQSESKGLPAGARRPSSSSTDVHSAHCLPSKSTGLRVGF